MKCEKCKYRQACEDAFCPSAKKCRELSVEKESGDGKCRVADDRGSNPAAV